MPKRDLYERCPACDGTRELKYPAHVDRTRAGCENLYRGAPCPCCRDGYVATGMTAGQAERLVRDNERLRAELDVVADRAASWKNLAERWEEVAEARGAKIDLDRRAAGKPAGETTGG
jgi:hypothetical protein